MVTVAEDVWEAPYTLHPTPFTLHPSPLHATPYTLHLAPYTIHTTHCTPHPTPYTVHPKLSALPRQSESNSSFPIALICTTSRRIPASASANQGPKKGDLIPL